MTSEGRIRDDLGAINHWLSLTRLRAVALVFLLAMALWLAGEPVGLAYACTVLAALTAVSAAALTLRKKGGAELPFFYVQIVVDLAAITLGLAMALYGPLSILFRPLYVLVIIPASLVSVPSGLFAAAGATLGHEILLGLDQGMSFETLASVESLVPAALFFLVAQQCFFYGTHLEQKNEELARLAERLDESHGELAELVGVARILNSTIESPAIVARVNRLARERLEAQWGATLLIDVARQSFRVAAAEHVDRPGDLASAVEFPLDAWPVLKRLSRERRVMLVGAKAASVPAFLARDGAFSCVLVAGLFRDEELVGALAVGHAAIPEGGDPERVLRRLVDIAEHATIALRNAQLLEEARQASALKSEFVSTMSHELRTPLNVILGYAEILREEASEAPEEARELLDRIGVCGRQLLELVDATLQVGRLEAGAVSVQLEQVRLAELMESFASSTAGLPQPPDVALVWDCQEDLEGWIRTDRPKVALIVRNLVSNALKFTERGTVSVEVRGAGSTLEIEVRDTGIGVPEDKLSIIFDMFRQVGASSTNGQAGVGLGLYIVDQLVRRLEGEVRVESTPGEGTTFVVRLPNYRPAAATGRTTPASDRSARVA